MNINEISAVGSGFYQWDNVTSGQVWTNKGYRVDNAGRGDRRDLGIMMLRPDFVPIKSRGKRLRNMTVIVNDADRECVEYIIADYGKYPGNHKEIYSV